MASLTNQTDSYSKEEVATLVANKADGAAFTAVKNQIDNPLTGMVALSDSLEAKADAVYVTSLNTALGVVRNTVNHATTGVAALNTAMGNKADGAAFATTQGIVANATTGVAALNTAVAARALQSSLDARATDNLANINTTLTSPNPYISSGTWIFPVDIPTWTRNVATFTTGTTYPIANAAGATTNYATQINYPTPTTDLSFQQIPINTAMSGKV